MGAATENSQHQKEKSIQEDLSQTLLWIWEECMFWRWISVSETKQKSSQVWSCFPKFVALLMICTLNHGSEGNMIRSCFFCWHPMVSQCHCGCMMSTRKDADPTWPQHFGRNSDQHFTAPFFPLSMQVLAGPWERGRWQDRRSRQSPCDILGASEKELGEIPHLE